MKREIQVGREEPRLGLASEIVYLQKPYWCNCSTRKLSLSLIGPRQYYTYDPKGKYPLLVFICGGGFQKVDRNSWVPELTYFAKHGYIVASVDYSVLPYTVYPEQITEIKAAIRFLRAHAEDFHIIPDKVAVMGESAGGYFAALAALTNGDRQYDVGKDLDQSSEVCAAIPWYLPSSIGNIPHKDGTGTIRVSLDNFPDLVPLVTPKAPPFCMFHGTDDSQVPTDQSVRLYEKLIQEKVPADLYILKGADHGDAMFTQESVKKLMLSFLDGILK